jgi:hypothetical protein
MTDEQINIAIAEHLGVSVHPMDKARGEDCKAPWHGIRDYCNDLNAMREAEMSVVNSPKYWENLINIVLGFEYLDFDPTNEYSCLEVATASSQQRAEAFLKTIGKWDQK